MRKNRSAQGRKRLGWHVPSFVVGVLAGVACCLLVLRALDYFTEQVGKLPGAAVTLPGGEPEELIFRFDDLLKNSEVPAQPERYGSGSPSARPPEPQPKPAPAPPPSPQAFHIQAASFRDKADAEQLRAKLLLQGMPAVRSRVELDSGAWHRVTVGPVESAAQAKAMMNRLREQDLSAMWIKRG